MATRTITGATPTYPRSSIMFRQQATFVTTGATYPGKDYPASTDASGVFAIGLPVPDSGTVPYRIELPDGTAADLFIGAGAATTLEQLLAGAFAASSNPDLLAVLAQLVTAHAALIASSTILGHIKVGSGLAIDGTGVLSASGGGGAPSGPAGGVLAGTYPNPAFAADMATQAELDAAFIAHLAASDPHPVYLTAAEGNAAYSALGHTHSFASLTSKPTTLGGYGITDAVPSSRTLTINGVTLDLTADRSWTVSGGGTIDGSGIAGRVAQWSDSDTLTSANLIGPASNVLTFAAAGAYTLTIPQTGTAALKEIDNVFSAKQSIRATGSGDGLSVPYQSGDTIVAHVGSSSAGGGTRAILAETGSGIGILCTAGSGGWGIRVTAVDSLAIYASTGGTGNAMLLESTGSSSALRMINTGSSGFAYGYIDPTSTNDVKTMATWGRHTPGAAADGIGGAIDYEMETDSGAWVVAARDVVELPTAANASWKARQRFVIGDFSTTYNALTLEASGSAAMIGFLGASAIARQTVASNASDLATAITLVNDIKAKMQSFGLFN